MTSPDDDLRLLLRLRDHALSPDDEANLREKLLNNAGLRKLWRKLSAADMYADSNDHSPWEGAEAVAAAWDRQANRVAADDAAGTGYDELGCDDRGYDDLAALDRAAREHAEHAVPQGIADRLTRELEQHLGMEPVIPLSASTRDADSTVNLRANSSGKIGHHRQWTTWLVVGTAVALALVLIWRPWHSAPLSDPALLPSTRDLVDSVPPAQPPVPDPMPENPAPLQPEAVPSPEMTPSAVQPKTLVTVPAPLPPPTPVKIPTTDPRLPPLQWERIQGIVAERDDQSGEWHAVAPHETTLDGPTTWQTLGESWGMATAATGESLVLASHSRATLEIPKNAGLQLVVNDLVGSLAMSGLPLGTRVTQRAADRERSWEITAAGSVVVLESRTASQHVSVLSGAIQYGGQVVESRQSLIFAGESRPGIEAGPVALSWLERPPLQPPLERRLTQSFEGGSDLAQRLLALQPSPSEAELLLAARWSLQLDPEKSLPVAMVSNSTTQRLAAIEWLGDEERTSQEIALARLALRTSLAGTSLPVLEWYRAARGEIPVRASMLQELAQGTTPGEPLFVRHTAIEFLRRLLKHPFATYDPAQPTRTALLEVRAIVRQQSTAFPP